MEKEEGAEDGALGQKGRKQERGANRCLNRPNGGDNYLAGRLVRRSSPLPLRRRRERRESAAVNCWLSGARSDTDHRGVGIASSKACTSNPPLLLEETRETTNAGLRFSASPRLSNLSRV